MELMAWADLVFLCVFNPLTKTGMLGQEQSMTLTCGLEYILDQCCVGYWAYGSGSLMSGHGMWILQTNSSQAEFLGKTEHDIINCIIFVCLWQINSLSSIEIGLMQCWKHPSGDICKMALSKGWSKDCHKIPICQFLLLDSHWLPPPCHPRHADLLGRSADLISIAVLPAIQAWVLWIWLGERECCPLQMVSDSIQSITLPKWSRAYPVWLPALLLPQFPSFPR